MKKLLISVLIITMFFTVMCCSVRADSTTIEVGTQQEWFDALAQIHASSNETFIISVTQDITMDDSTLFTSGSTIDNGNKVTILGNGHTLKFVLTGNEKIRVSNATLNLGVSDGSNTLNIEGAGPSGVSGNSLVTIYNNGTLNMYDGVSLSNNYSGHMALSGCGVSIGEDSTFNMYGGSIHNNKTTTGGQGGAIVVDNTNGKLNMYGGEIKNNYSCQLGGAIFVLNGNKVEITGGTISNNRADFGGALANQEGVVSIKNATISSNNATYYGGGIYNQNNQGDSSVTLESSTVTNNTAWYGGGIMNYGTGFVLKNNTIAGNTATGYTESSGGAVYNASGILTSENNTISNNNASYRGGGIHSEAEVVSKNDDINKNTAQSGGGVFLEAGTANLATTKVYNNKAQIAGNDYGIDSNVTSIKIIDAGDIDEEAQIGGETIPVNMWHKDEESNRFSLTNETGIIQASEITAGTEYYLVAANGGCKVYFDDDGEQSTANAKKTFVKGRKVKLNANGGAVTSDEIDLTSDSVTIENPTRTGYKFIGWTEEDVEGYDLGLKANWEEETEEEPASDDENKTGDDEEESPAEAEKEESQEESPKSTKGVSTGDTIVKWISALGLATLVFSLTTIKLKNSKLKGKRFK